MTDKDQVMRYSNQELEIIKITFNEDMLMLFRKFFFDGAMTADEQKALTIFKDNKPAVEVLRKNIIPNLEPDAPFYQSMDMYLTIETKGRHPDEVFHEMQIRDVLVEYFEQKFTELTTGLTPTITLQGLVQRKVPMTEGRQATINLGGRNLIVYHIDQHIGELKELAKQKEETKEEQEERAKKDSVE